jgi:hypothetical protein
MCEFVTGHASPATTCSRLASAEAKILLIDQQLTPFANVACETPWSAAVLVPTLGAPAARVVASNQAAWILYPCRLSFKYKTAARIAAATRDLLLREIDTWNTVG